MNFRGMAPIDPSILDSRRGGKERVTGVYTKYMTVTNDDANKAEIQKATAICQNILNYALLQANGEVGK